MKATVRIRYAKKLKALGSHIRKLREKKGLTQERLAESARLSTNSIHTLEAGRLNPSAALLFALADALNCPYTELFDFQ